MLPDTCTGSLHYENTYIASNILCRQLVLHSFLCNTMDFILQEISRCILGHLVTIGWQARTLSTYQKSLQKYIGMSVHKNSSNMSMLISLYVLCGSPPNQQHISLYIFVSNFTAYSLASFRHQSLLKLDSRLLCNATGASPLAKRYYILIRALELTLHGQPRSNVVVQITQWKMTSAKPFLSVPVDCP